MTLTQQNRTRIQALCTDLRPATWPTWDAAGTEAAILELSKQMPNDPLGVAVRALTAARNPANRGPSTMLNEPAPEAVVRTITPPRHDDDPCEVHGGTVKGPYGYVCCTQANATPRPTSPVPPSLRPACPAPAGLREQVAQALNRGARNA